MPILCLHGIAQENNNPDWLWRLWEDSLVQGFDNAGIQKPDYRLEVPFYGDLLAGLAATSPPVVVVSVEDLYRGTPDTPDMVAVSTDDLCRDPTDILDIKAEVEQELGRRTQQRPIDIEEQMRGPGNTLLQLISKCLPVGTEARLIDTALDQVGRYLDQHVVRAQIQARAQESLERCFAQRTAEDSTVIVIAHSLGSVVGLDLLSSWKGAAINLLITVGSPLSIRGVYSRLTVQPPSWPDCVQNWINLADQDDIVALHGRIDRTNLFSGHGLRGPRRRCDVLNVLDIKNHMPNHHGIAGYLDDPVLATIVGRHLQGRD